MPGASKRNQKPVKDRDLKTLTYFMRVAGLTVPFLCLLGLYIGYVHWDLPGAVSGIIVAATIGLSISAVIMFMMDKASSAASNLLSGRREAVWTTREQVQGYLSQARFNKDNQNYTEAFSFANKVLEKDPDYAEALLLKAQILWEGFGRADAAVRFLEKSLSLNDGDSMLQSQARLLHGDLSLLENNPSGPAVPPGVNIGLKDRRSSAVQKLAGESYQGLKNQIEETPVAIWAVYTALVFGLFLLCILVNMHIQIHRLDQASTVVSQTIESTRKTTKAQAEGIQKIEVAVQKMNSELTRVKNKLDRK